MTLLLHNYDSALRYGAKILQSEVLGGGLPFTFGNVYYVDYDSGSDTANDGLSPQSAFKTVAFGYSQMVTNNDDVLVLSGVSSHPLTAMLNITKSRCHFIGDVWGRLYGESTKLVMGVTTATTDVHAVKNIGVRNTFTGIKFVDNNTLTQNTSCFGEGGEYTLFANCEFEASGKQDSDTYAELLLNGDSTQFFNCTFGSTSIAVVGDKVRPAVITTAGGVASGVTSSKDILFDGCKFLKNAGGTTTTMVTITAAADLTRGFMEFKDCSFIANKTGSVPAVAIGSATLTASQVLLTGSTIAYNCTKIGTATGIINGTPARVATATIGIQAT